MNLPDTVLGEDAQSLRPLLSAELFSESDAESASLVRELIQSDTSYMHHHGKFRTVKPQTSSLLQ